MLRVLTTPIIRSRQKLAKLEGGSRTKNMTSTGGCSYSFVYLFVIPHSLTVVMHFKYFCNNYISNIKAKLVYHLNSRSEINRKHKSHVMSSLISGSTPAQSSCVHFEHDIQQIHVSPLAEIRKVSRQKIHSSSSSSFVFSLLLVSCIFGMLWIFSLWTCFLLHCMVILVFFKVSALALLHVMLSHLVHVCRFPCLFFLLSQISFVTHLC